MIGTSTSVVLVEVHPTATRAADLPLAMVRDVLRVLPAHGLDPDPLDVSTALYRVVTSTPVDRGGRIDTRRPSPAVSAEALEACGPLERISQRAPTTASSACSWSSTR